MMQPFMMGYNNVSEQDFTYFKEMEARTGVKLDLKAISMFSVSEQFSLMVTSGDYADMIEGATAYYSGGGSKAIADGFLMDINDYLDVMPNYTSWLDSDPSYRRDITTMDGGIAYAALKRNGMSARSSVVIGWMRWVWSSPPPTTNITMC